jgi:hypothetical protein
MKPRTSQTSGPNSAKSASPLKLKRLKFLRELYSARSSDCRSSSSVWKSNSWLTSPFTAIDAVYRLLRLTARHTSTAMHICSAVRRSIWLMLQSPQGYALPHFPATFHLSQLCDAGTIQIMKRGRAAEPEAAKRVRRSTQSRRRLAPPSLAALRIDLTFPLVFRILSVESYRRSGARG